MKGFDPDPKLRRLFCFTHPDDELGIAAWVRRLTCSGVGNGGVAAPATALAGGEIAEKDRSADPPRRHGGHEGSTEGRDPYDAAGPADLPPRPEGATQRSAADQIHLSWTHRTPAREREARAFAVLIGVPESNLHFHAGEDRRVCDQLGELLPSFQSMMAAIRPDVVVCAAFEQGHLDHDATHWLVTHSFDGPVFEYPMYHPYTRRIQTMGRFEDPLGEEVMPLTPEEGRFKNRLSKCYRSQNIRSVVFWYSVYRALCLRPARFRRFERLRPVGEVDYLTPNLPEPMRSEVERSEMWRRWLAAMRAAA